HFPWGRPRQALPGTAPPWSPDFPLPAMAESGHPAVWQRKIWVPARGLSNNRGRSATLSRIVPQGRLSIIFKTHPKTLRRRSGIAMSAILGTDSFRYQVVDDWAKLPDGWALNADVAAVGVDKNDNVYCFNRGEHPMIVFDRNGNFLRSWG